MIDSLYAQPKERIVYGKGNWVEGIEGKEGVVAQGARVASLAEFQEERANLKDRGRNITGRIATGIAVIPKGALFGTNAELQTRIVQRGLCLINPIRAVQANSNGKWYGPCDEKPEEIARCLDRNVIIDEYLDNGKNYKTLELRFDEADRSLRDVFEILYGRIPGRQETGEQIRQRVKKAVSYLEEESKRESINLYVPVQEAVDNSNLQGQRIIGTQLWVGGADVEFDLDGYNRVLNIASGVFGVKD